MSDDHLKSRGPRIWDVKTPWTLLLQTHADRENLEKLLRVYMDPVYAFYRAQGLKLSDAEDLTQSVLLDFFVVRKSHTSARPVEGRFRNFLLAAARNGLLNWKKHKQTKRRGGGQPEFSIDQLGADGAGWEPAGGLTPDEEYERQWAVSTWRAALELFRSREDPQLVEAFEMFYTGDSRPSQQQAAGKLGISVAAFNSRIHTARRKIFECIQDIVRVTVEDQDELNEEMERIRDHLAKSGM